MKALLVVVYLILCRLRKPLEKLRPPSVTELLLSNDGDQLLEGSITNFFVVCRKVCDCQSNLPNHCCCLVSIVS